MKKGLINSQKIYFLLAYTDPKQGLHTGVDCPDFKEAGTPGKTDMISYKTGQQQYTHTYT